MLKSVKVGCDEKIRPVRSVGVRNWLQMANFYHAGGALASQTFVVKSPRTCGDGSCEVDNQ